MSKTLKSSIQSKHTRLYLLKLGNFEKKQRLLEKSMKCMVRQIRKFIK